MENLLLSDALTDLEKAGLGGFVIGLLFGAAAQASRFCLRSACIEFWRGSLGPKVAVWLLVFGFALLLVQAQIAAGTLSVTDIRQLSSGGTLSGALIGGLMFGVGMILARGCASRLLVLSATGNLRALVAGLVVTVVAQAALSGVLSPLREGLSRLWVVAPPVRNLMLHLPEYGGLVIGAATVGLAAYLCWRERLGWWSAATGALVGAAVAAGWAFTSALSKVSFTPVTVGSVTFTGPSADTLMALITTPTLTPEFGLGLVPGVFAGSFLMSVVRGEFKVQTFDLETGTRRYLVGAALMGFGGMLAGGCAVGAGVTGGSVMSLTAWVALAAMWAGAGAADYFVDRRPAAPATAGIQASAGGGH